MRGRVPRTVVIAMLLSVACGTSASSSKDAGEAEDARVDRFAPPPPPPPAADARARDATTPDSSKVPPGDASSCHGTPTVADRARWIVVSHPFDEAQNAASDFELFSISETGAITEPNVHFSLGPTTDGEIAFTPDGAVGIVAEDDGTLGVFRIDGSGTPTVVSASQSGSYYATGVSWTRRAPAPTWSTTRR